MLIYKAFVDPDPCTFTRRLEIAIHMKSLKVALTAIMLLIVTLITGTTVSPVTASASCPSPTQQSTNLIPRNRVVGANAENSGQIYSGPVNYAETSYEIVRAGGGSMQAYTFAGLPDNLPFFSVGQAYGYDPFDLGHVYQVWQTNLEFDTRQIPAWRTITSVYIELDYAYDWSPNSFFIEARPANYVTHNVNAWVAGSSITTSAPAAFSRFGNTTGCTVRMIGDLTNHINRGGISKFNLTPSNFAANVPSVSGDGSVGFTGARLIVNYSISDFLNP